MPSEGATVVADMLRAFVVFLFLAGIVVGALVASLMWWVLR